ncbi:MAG: tetratricopeptide repeat protein [Alphaproteobacteria bacterium]|nr:tetratricopeptide repeat protein [Alphaproteobacteria bacterium]
MNFSPLFSFKISAKNLKNPLSVLVFLTFFSPITRCANPSLDQEFHALRTELDQVNEKIARLERRVRAERFTPVSSAHDEEDQWFTSPEPQDQSEKESEDDTTAPRTLSIDQFIAGIPPFSHIPVPPGWVVGTVSASALAAPVGPNQSKHGTLAPEITVQQAKLFLEKRQMQHARHILAQLVRDRHTTEYPFALYWLGILDLHENHLESAFALFSKVYDLCAVDPNSNIQQLCVAALLRMAQTRLRQNNVLDATTHYERCQNLAKSLTIPLPRHITYGIRKLRSALKKANPSPSAERPNPERDQGSETRGTSLGQVGQLPAPRMENATSTASPRPISAPLNTRPPAGSGPVLLSNPSNDPSAQDAPVWPSDTTDDESY